MKKFNLSVLCLILSFFVLVFSGFAYDGLMTGENKIYTVSTKWFDIIFPEECAESAKILSENCDAIYEDLVSVYGQPIVNRLPVVITRETEVYNAYFTLAMYNRIVLYDTFPTEDFADMKDTLLDCFRHELDHAYTMTMTNKFWTKVASVMGDTYILGDYLNVSSFFAESASVFYESMEEGCGRLNDGYYLHKTRQNKVDNAFLGWNEVFGARDLYPGRQICYNYGGPFADYLVNKYGIEKYSELWYKSVNCQGFLFQGIFKKVYKISIDKAWKDFKDSYYNVEDVTLVANGKGGVENFFKGNQKGSNDYKNRYSGFVAFDGGFIYKDEVTRNVYTVKEDGRSDLLVNHNLLDRATISRDGKFVALTLYDENGAASTEKVSVYSVKGGFLLPILEEGLRDACIIEKNGKYYLCAVKLDGKNLGLKVYELMTRSNGSVVYDAEEVGCINFGRDTIVSSLTDAGEGALAVICNNALNYSVRVYDDFAASVIGGSEVSYTECPLSYGNCYKMRELNFNGMKDGKRDFTFSYATKENFPGMGRLLVGDGGAEASFLKENLSGGVYSPVEFNGKIAYSAWFSDKKCLYLMDESAYQFETVKVSANNAVAKVEGKPAVSDDVIAFVNGAEIFNNIYKYKGMFIPASSVPAVDFNPEKSFGLTSKRIVYGFTYMTLDPWMGTSITASSLHDWINRSWGAAFSISGGTDTDAFKYSEGVSVIVDTKGFDQALNIFSAKSTVYFGKTGYLALNVENNTLLGRNYTTDNNLYEYFLNLIKKYQDMEPKKYDETYYLYTLSQGGVNVGTSRRVGCGEYELLGASASVDYTNLYIKPLSDFRGYAPLQQVLSPSGDFFLQQVTPSVGIRLPWIIPAKSVKGFTFNLPTTASVSLYPDVSGQYVLGGNANTTLFAAEIQKALGYVPLYLNDVFVTASYTGMFGDGRYEPLRIKSVVSDFAQFNKLSYVDEVDLKAQLNWSINAGSIASVAGLFGVYVEWTFSPVLQKFNLPDFGIKLNQSF